MDELNRSCDRCGLKKRKCSGEKPCHRCVRSRATCTYSRRRPRTPSRRQVAPTSLGSASHSSTSNTWLQVQPKPTIKRLRLSASPATGLVGMEENTFLCDFFGSMGFMPLATPSGIREAMIKIILPSSTLQQSAVDLDCDGHEAPNTLVPGRGVRDTLWPADPSACTFWCAVAMGALVKGRPIESVATYARLATDALTSFSGPVNTEISQAWTILGYMNGLMGDQETFHEYLALSEGFLHNCVEKGQGDMLPVGVAETIKMGDAFKLFMGDMRLEEVEESLFSEDIPRPQVGQLAPEGDLCRQIFRSARAFEQAILSGIMCRGRKVVGCEDVGEEGDIADAGSAVANATAADRSGGASPFRSPHRPVELLPSPLSPAALECLGNVFEFRRLEEVVESPSVRSGIGGLAINDRLLYKSTARGDARGALDRVERCIEIYERYPGMHRFCMGAHKTHNMITILVAVANPRAGKLYHRMRTAFNLARPPGFLEVPPWEEWEGVSAFCDNEACRSVEAMLTGEESGSAFASPPLTCVTDEEQRDRAPPTDSKQSGENANVSPEPNLLSHREPSAVIWSLPVAGPTMPTIANDETPLHVGTETSPIGDIRGGNVDARGGEELCADLFAQGAEVSLPPLDPRRASSSETEDGRVVAEDWLEAVHAIDSSESDTVV